MEYTGWIMIRVNLFISSFRKYKKTIISIVSLFIFLNLLFLCHKALWYILVDDTNAYTRTTLHELYTQKENIDILFLGSSHCYRSLDTTITDKIFDTNTFNAGTSQQVYDGSYALLVEAGKYYDLKEVYVELYYDLAGTDYQERTQMTQTYIISDYIKPSFNRLRYLLNASSSEHWINSFFPERRNWDKLFDGLYISDLIEKKSEASYKDFEYVENPEVNQYYMGKGFVANNDAVQNNNYFHNDHFQNAQRGFSKDDINTLKNIIDYCQEHHIKLVFFSAPMPDFRVMDTGDYDLYIQQVNDFLTEYNIPYFDFNLCKETYFSYDCSLFKDDEHLNTLGAEEFSRLFSDFFTGKIQKEDLFYSSYKEKMESIDEHFYGLIYRLENTDSVKTFTFESVQNRDFDYYVSIFKKPSEQDNFEEIQVMENSINPVSLPVNETGQLFIYIYNDKQGINMTNEIVLGYN